MHRSIEKYLTDVLRVTNLEYIGRGGYAEVWSGDRDKLRHAFKISVYPLDEKLKNMADEEFKFVTHDAIRDCEQIVKLHGWDEATGHLITWWDLGKQSLGDRLKSHTDAGLPPDELRRYLFDVAKAIDVINGQGFKHRDIKPDNLLVFRDGGVKVADFGLTKFTGASTMSMTARGTPMYAAPEVYSAENNSRGNCKDTVDIYSLAATAIKLTTGRDPFLGQNPVTIWQAKVAHQAVTEGLTTSQKAVVLAALHPDPAQRPKTAMEFVNAFLDETVVGQPTRPSSPQVPAKVHKRLSESWWSRMKSWWSELWSPSSAQAPAKEYRRAVESEIQAQPKTRPANAKVTKTKAKAGKLLDLRAELFRAAANPASTPEELHALATPLAHNLSGKRANSPAGQTLSTIPGQRLYIISEAFYGVSDPALFRSIGENLSRNLDNSAYDREQNALRPDRSASARHAAGLDE